MITERHNLACSKIFKAISKTGSCFVSMDIGSSERLATQNLQVPNTAETRNILLYCYTKVALSTLLLRREQVLSPAVQMQCWLLPSPQKQKKQQASDGGGWVSRSGRGQIGETRSILAAPPAIGRSTFPKQHRPKYVSILQRDIHLIEIK
jgi:hypothetical protein